MTSYLISDIHRLSTINDSAFWRNDYTEPNTELQYSYKNTTYKKWLLTNIENIGIVYEQGLEILPVTYDSGIMNSKLNKGKGLYIIEEFNLTHSRDKFTYIAIFRKMLTKSFYAGVSEGIEHILEELKSDSLVYPYRLILTHFISQNWFIENELTDFGDFNIYVDANRDNFKNIDIIKVDGKGIRIDINFINSVSKNKNDTFAINKNKFKIKKSHALVNTNKVYIVETKSKETDKIYTRNFITDDLLNIEVRPDEGLFKTHEANIKILDGLENILSNILQLNTNILEQERKTRKEVIELTINSLKAIFAENKVYQSALNAAKEEIALNKEEVSKNKEIIKTVGEIGKAI